MKYTFRADPYSTESLRGARQCTVIRLPRKSAKRLKMLEPVPQTDTGSRVEYIKALERIMVKELGKLTP